MIDKTTFDRLDKLDKSVIIAIVIVLFLLVVGQAEAQEYKFGPVGAPNFSSEKTGLVFKSAEQPKDSDVMKDPVNLIKNDQPFKGYVDYPRYQLTLDYAPTSNGFKQEYNGTPLNFSSFSTSSAGVKASFIASPNYSFEIEYAHADVSVKNKDLIVYQVKESSANLDTTLGRFLYCDILNHSSNKICYGLVVGMDAYPSLAFENATELSLTTIKDFVIGGRVGYQRVVLPFVQVNTSLEYLYGLRLGQDSALGVNADSQIKLHLGLDFQNAKNLDYFSVGTNYSYRDATVHGVNGGFVDTWTTQASAISVNLSYAWIWE